MSESQYVSVWPYHYLPKETNKTIVLELVAVEREWGMREGEKEIVYPHGENQLGNTCSQGNRMTNKAASKMHGNHPRVKRKRVNDPSEHHTPA